MVIDRAAVAPARAAAVIAGWSYVAIMILAVLGNVAISSLIVLDDPGRTIDNLARGEGPLRLGTAALVGVCVLDLVVAWGLHAVLGPGDRRASLLAAWLRIAFAAILTVAVSALVIVGDLVTATGPGVAFSGDDRAAQIVLLGAMFFTTWEVGLLIFGAHLVVVGVILVRAPDAPRALGWVLVAAGVGYGVNTMARILLPTYGDLGPWLLALYAIPSFVGELWLAIWLVQRAAR